MEQIRQQLEIPEKPTAHVLEKLRHPVGRLFLIFVGSTFVGWTYLMLVYPLTSLTCEWGWFAATGGGSTLKLAQGVTTILAAASLLYFGFAAYREWQHARTADNTEESEAPAARTTLLAFVTLLLNALYFLIVALSLVPILLLPACA